ncbi:MAG: hypothetical protein A3J63_02405 [Candidatus Moranbacteria bacterium RIFCSPHIGHO2_02_FULL_40_12b]|nr:MAG: hypothetical protein A3J63_02405 [Candidatus Moranbacteria bacterium RIFCSPHIGHO2_02_FULL_40_12b]OGI23761.1 MAG: hypothetical protein A3E91_02930 [Candidatus Moranbacteria bacterium RIFCSPHIGHO2_12_FULL_40_10]
MRNRRRKKRLKKLNKVTVKRIHHAMRRAKKRYQVQLTDEDIRRIANIIKKNESTFIFREILTKTHHQVEYQGIRFFVVYSSKSRTVLTVLTQEQAKSRYKFFLERNNRLDAEHQEKFSLLD